MAKIRDDQGGFMAEVCNRCYAEAIDNGQTEAEIVATMDGNGEDRYSFGVYAGHFCSDHWKRSGYRNSTEETLNDEFDPDYAGESMEEEP